MARVRRWVAHAHDYEYGHEYEYEYEYEYSHDDEDEYAHEYEDGAPWCAGGAGWLGCSASSSS